MINLENEYFIEWNLATSGFSCDFLYRDRDDRMVDGLLGGEEVGNNGVKKTARASGRETKDSKSRCSNKIPYKKPPYRGRLDL